MKKSEARIMVAAGGTGGHLFPAMAVVEQLMEQGLGSSQFIFVGTPDKIESRIVPEQGFRFESLPIRGLTSLRSFSTLRLPIQVLQSTWRCAALIKSCGVQAVLCAGAYISYPAGLAAARNNCKLYLMQADANPGKAVKALAKKADRIFVSFQESHQYFDQSLRSKLQVSGNPVRRDFFTMPAKTEARQHLGLDAERPTLFVFGGSLGARSINQAMQQHLQTLVDAGIQIIWQTGRTFDPKSVAAPQGVQISEFIDDMPTAYAAADVVLARAGATTVAELATLSKPSILVPLPTASNDEQSANARVMRDGGAALWIKNDEISTVLPSAVRELIGNPQKLAAMSKAAAGFAKPDAGAEIAATILRDLNVE